MSFPYPGLFAIDPNDASNVAANAELKIFDPTDMAQTPIALADSSGMPIPNPLLTNDKGFIGGFYAEIDEVGWQAGELQGLIQSFSGLRTAVMEARTGSLKAATEAAEAANEARNAANLVDAPADQTVSMMLQDGNSQSYDAASAIMEMGIQPVRSAVQTAADPLAYLDNLSLLCAFPVRENGEMSWPQGFAINEDARELYVANQNGPELRIDIRNLNTGVRAASKIFTTENGAFTESLDWFYAGNDLCFIVWPKAGGATPSAYAIANFTQGTLGPQIPIYGFTRGCRDGSKFVTSDAWTTTVSKFYIYDWESVKAGIPLLIDTIKVSNPGTTAAKNQGISAIGGKVFLAQGSQTENPTITAYHADGRIADARTYPRQNFMDAVNELVPGLLTNHDYLYECEGAASAGGKLVTGQIVNNNPAVTADGVVLIIQHNNVGGVRAMAERAPLKLVGDWHDLVLESGWANVAGNGMQVRLKDGNVEFRGFGQHATFTGGYTKVATLPTGIPAPERDCIFPISGNTTAVRSVRITATREIQFYTSAATAAWYPVSSAKYGL